MAKNGVGFFNRLKASLARTKESFLGRLDEIVGRETATADTTVSAEALDELEELLLMADVGVATATRVVDAVRTRAGRGAPLRDLIKEELRQILREVDAPPRATSGPAESSADDSRGGPHVVMIVGVNGTGKTTTVGKLANLYRTRGGRPLICAADTFRAAAVEQLEVWAGRAGVEMIRARSGADPAAVVFDAVTACKARGRDLLLIDTAGRLHTRVNLMSELDKIRRVVAREVAGAPHEVLLVLDATVGQNGLVQAREFTSVAGVNGIVLAKLDGTARGGIVVAIAHDLHLPIRYVGTGEGIDDLLPFSADEFVDALFEQTF